MRSLSLGGTAGEAVLISRHQPEIIATSRKCAREIFSQATRSSGDQGVTCLRHFDEQIRPGMGNYPLSTRANSGLPSPVQTMSHVCGKASLKNDIPNPAGESEPSLHNAGSVMIDVVLSAVSEIRILEVVEVY